MIFVSKSGLVKQFIVLRNNEKVLNIIKIENWSF